MNDHILQRYRDMASQLDGSDSHEQYSQISLRMLFRIYLLHFTKSSTLHIHMVSDLNEYSFDVTPIPILTYPLQTHMFCVKYLIASIVFADIRFTFNITCFLSSSIRSPRDQSFLFFCVSVHMFTITTLRAIHFATIRNHTHKGFLKR